MGYDSDDVIHHIHTVQLRGQLRTFLFRRLLEAGNVDPKESDNSNVTPLMYAAGCKHSDPTQPNLGLLCRLFVAH